MPTEVTDPAILAQLNAPAASRGNVFTLAPDPMKVAEQQRQAQKDAQAQEIARAEEARNQQKAQRDFLEWQATHNPDGSPKLNITQRPTLTAKERADALAGYTSATQLDSIISQIEQQYKAGPGATSGLFGLKDYLPTTANSQFDSTGNAARGTVGSALGFTGGQLNTATEAQMAVGPYLPQASDRDSVILDKIQRLKELRDLAKQRSVAILGGVPDVNGNVTPAPQNAPVQRDPLNDLYINGQADMQAAGFGSDTKATAVPPEMQQEHAAYLAAHAGNLNEQDYIAFREALDHKYGFNSSSREANAEWVRNANDSYRKGGRTFGAVPPAQEKMSLMEQGRNNLVNNPLGAAAAGFADAGSFGGVTALAPGQMGALQDARPYSTMTGEALGAIGATKGIGMAGDAISGAANARGLIPSNLSPLSPFTRNLMTDAAYGGTYGGVTQGDPLTGAVVGGGASMLGQGAGKAIGGAIGGMDLAPAAAYLKSQGVPLTVGQNAGGMLKAIEDRATSMPIVGDMIGARRREGLQAFNQAAFNEAGAPIGYSAQSIGEQGLNDLKSAAGNAYDNATAGVSVPLDAQFPQELAAIGAKSRMLPPDLNTRFSAAMDNAIQPIAIGSDMTGDAYQQAMRGLKGYKAEMTKPGFEQDYRDLLSQAQGALKGQMMRGGGPSVVDGINNADKAYRMSKTIQQSIEAAKNDVGGAGIQVFTPAQLNTAAYRTAKKFPGPRPFADLADNAQQVLPSKVPDSGTAGRAMQLALGLGAGAGGADAMGYDNTAKGLALATLLAAGGTKTGQKVLNAAIFGRPDAAKAAGRFVSKQKRLAGAAAVPLLLEASK